MPTDDEIRAEIARFDPGIGFSDPQIAAIIIIVQNCYTARHHLSESANRQATQREIK
jgi:hypothetical protein